MCNACGFYCCAYDGFSGCGCEHCWCDDCQSDDGCDDDGDEFICEPVDVGDELHQVLGEALKADRPQNPSNR